MMDGYFVAADVRDAGGRFLIEPPSYVAGYDSRWRGVAFLDFFSNPLATLCGGNFGIVLDALTFTCELGVFDRTAEPA